MNSRRWHIRLGLNYCQLTVCQAGLQSPFNDWTEIHANQRFTWRSGSVSFGTFDTDTPGVRAHCEVDAAAQPLLRVATQRLQLSARAFQRVLKLARTIADLAGSDTITAPPVAEALQYRARGEAG